jgi:putative ABC transport system ATP-binding protein
VQKTMMEADTTPPANENDGFLRLVGLSKTYEEAGRKRLVLDQASLSARRGEALAVLGKSGSGKTTLLNLVSGIDRADQGEVYLGDTNLSALNERARTLFRRQRVGFIFQFFNLISTLSVWENVVLPLELNGRMGAEGETRARELLEEVGLTGREQAFPDRLSGGEQQRVAIARALVHGPDLLLADEPTGNLDEETGRHVQDLLERLTRAAGKNLILVTHSPEAAARMDRVFTLREGRLVEGKA